MDLKGTDPKWTIPLSGAAGASGLRTFGMDPEQPDRNQARRVCFICGGDDLATEGSIHSCQLLKCRRCGLQFLDPQVDDETLGRIHADYHRIWDLVRFADQVTRMKKRTFTGYLSRASRFIESGCLLDIGCGCGELLEVFEESGFDVYGVEVSPAGARRCVERFGAQKILSKQLEEDDFPRGFFDIITLSDVFEHMRDPRSLVDLMDALLRPTGIVMITTPDTATLSNRLMGLNWPHYKQEHLYYYNRSNIVRLFSERFEPLEVRPAVKALTPRYGLDVLKATSSNRVILGVADALDWLPRKLAFLPLTFAFGEMFVLLRKRDRSDRN